MSASLVGSEMCIRDRASSPAGYCPPRPPKSASGAWRVFREGLGSGAPPTRNLPETTLIGSKNL
eukprot:8463804-Alexandrium_andersonii.AAC.1